LVFIRHMPFSLVGLNILFKTFLSKTISEPTYTVFKFYRPCYTLLLWS
jgi:hypothetical protein